MSDRPRVLLVEDDGDWLEFYEAWLSCDEYELSSVQDIKEAFYLLELEGPYDVVVTDLKYLGFKGDWGGFEVLERTKELSPNTSVIVITAFGSDERAIQAMRAGAYDYVEKSSAREKLQESVKRAIVVRRQKMEFRKELNHGDQRDSRQIEVDNIIGNSPAMQAVFRGISWAARQDVPTLIMGEKGTGKELIARAIHANSAHGRQYFGLIPCHELAHYWLEFQRRVVSLTRGTLFLDTIEALDPILQLEAANLVGRWQVQGFRLIASTRLEMKQLRENADENLLHRKLGDLFDERSAIQVPPLRDRRSDIPSLVGHFLKDIAPGKGVSVEALRLLIEYDYRNHNVRELRQVVAFSSGRLGSESQIRPEHLPARLDPSVSAIRSLLRDAFMPMELRRFCQERPAFSPVLAHFSPSSSLEAMIDVLIDYCRTRLLFPELLFEVERVNPRQYKRHFP